MKQKEFNKESLKKDIAGFVNPRDFESKEIFEISIELVKLIAKNTIESIKRRHETNKSSPGKVYLYPDYIETIEDIEKTYITDDYIPQKKYGFYNYEDEPEIEKYANHEIEDITSTMQEYPEYDHERIYKKVYQGYVKAMERKPDRSPLTYSGFFSHYFLPNNYQEPKIFGNDEKGYLLGQEMEGIFIPHHFAPASLKAGVSLIRDLNIRKVSTCFFIPKDLRETIVKIPGWKTINYPIMMSFRGELVEKYPVFNDLNSILSLVKQQTKKFYYDYKNKFDNFVFTKKNYLTRTLRQLSEIADYSKGSNSEGLAEILSEIDSQNNY